MGEITRDGMSEDGDSGETGYRFLDITDCVFHDLMLGNIFSQYRISFQINSDFDNRADIVGFVGMEGSTEQNWPKVYYTLYNPSAVADEYVPGALMQINASPNPFSGQFSIEIRLPRQTGLEIKLYDLKGRMVKKQATTPYSKGTHNIDMETSDLSNGIYLLQVKAGSEIITKKITCLK